jgi:hypothetical protein
MLDLKIMPDIANESHKTVFAEQLALQLNCLSDRVPKDLAATFVKAVREGWAPPAKYIERQRAVERAKKVRQDQEDGSSQKGGSEGRTTPGTGLTGTRSGGSG